MKEGGSFQNERFSFLKIFIVWDFDPQNPPRAYATDSGQDQWALLQLESRCDVIKRLFSTAKAGQDQVSVRKAHSWKRMVASCSADGYMFRLRYRNFELTQCGPNPGPPAVCCPLATFVRPSNTLTFVACFVSNKA